MKNFLVLLTALSMLFFAFGCDDDDTTTNSTSDEFVEGTIADNAGFLTTSLNATSYDNFVYYSLADQSIVSSTGNWNIAFSRFNVMLNGLTEGDGKGIDLGGVVFDDVTLADTASLEWYSFAENFVIDAFPGENYTGGPDHVVLPNNYVYAMIDATGDHHIKLRINSISDYQVGQMGTVSMTYFYQSAAGSTDLDGEEIDTSFVVGGVKTYFDFSSGYTVTPTNPATSLDWDIYFVAEMDGFKVILNNGLYGSGACRGVKAYVGLTDSTDINGYTTFPVGPPPIADIPRTILMTNPDESDSSWYNYGSDHSVTSKNHVYIIKFGSAFYKLQMESYVGILSGLPVSGLVSFKWEEL